MMKEGPMRLVIVMASAVGLALGAQPEAPATGNDFDRPMADAVRLHDAGRYGEAVAVYEALLKDQPQHPLALYEAAYSSFSAGKSREAIDYAERLAAARLAA